MFEIETISNQLDTFLIKKRLSKLEKYFPKTAKFIRKRGFSSYHFDRRINYCTETLDIKFEPGDYSFYAIQFTHYKDKIGVNYYSTENGWSSECFSEKDKTFPEWIRLN